MIGIIYYFADFCEPGYFQCKSNDLIQCIFLKKRCDGKEDCYDGSDEHTCGKTISVYQCEYLYDIIL